MEFSMSLNVFDVGIVLVLIMFFIVGLKSGAIKEAFSLLGTIIVFALAYCFKGALGNLFCIAFPFFRFKGILEGMSSINILFYQIIAFMVLFCILLSVYLVIISISNVLQKVVNMTIILIPVSKVIGGIISFIKGYIIMFIVFLLLTIPLRNDPTFAGSKLVNKIVYDTPILSGGASGVTTCIAEIFNLGSLAANKEITSTEANTRTVELMLKYNVVSKETIRTLVYKNKLDNVVDIESILNSN